MRRLIKFGPLVGLAVMLATLGGACHQPRPVTDAPSGFAGTTQGPLPKGWIRAGSHPAQYDMGVDSTVVHSGKASAFIRSQGGTPEGFGTLMQTSAAETYRGKRLRFSAFARTNAVADWAGLWLRVDGEGTPPAVLAFDNMQDRPLKGTSEWQRHEIVLDVPEGAQRLAFGILLGGAGSVWIDDLQFEIVESSVPVTGRSSSTSSPANLNFEQP